MWQNYAKPMAQLRPLLMDSTPVASPAAVPAVRELVLALADDDLCIGQNHSWWIAVGPFLEEDLAFISIAQDELGHARALYGLLSSDPVQPNDPAQINALAYRRAPAAYRSAHLTELPCHDWAYALARHFLYDTAEAVRWRALTDSSWAELGAVARRALAEERIHERHARSMLTRLLSTDTGREHLGKVLVELAPAASALFDLASSTEDLLSTGVMNADLVKQRSRWRDEIAVTLAPFDLVEFFDVLDMSRGNTAVSSDTAIDPGRRGIRSEHFAALHHEMVEVLELDPAANW